MLTFMMRDLLSRELLVLPQARFHIAISTLLWAWAVLDSCACFQVFRTRSRSIQDQMIVDLKKNAPRYVVIDMEWDNYNEPNESAVSSGVTALDDFIADTYFVVARFPPFVVLQRSNPHDSGQLLWNVGS